MTLILKMIYMSSEQHLNPNPCEQSTYKPIEVHEIFI